VARLVTQDDLRTILPTDGFVRRQDIRSFAGLGLSASWQIEPCVRRF
jgi:hypothetical protein